MPRKAKEKDIENEIIEENKKTTTKKRATRKKSEVDNEKTDNTTEKKKASSGSVKKAVTSKKTSDSATEKKSATSKKKAESSSEKKSTASKKKAESSSEKKSTASKKKAESSSEKKPTVSKKKAESSSEKKSTTSKKKSESSSEKKSTTSKKKSESTAKKKTSTTKKSVKAKKSAETETSTTPIQVLEYYDLPYKYGNTLVKLLAQTPKTLFVYWEVSDLDIKNFKEQYGEDFFNITKPILIVHNLTLNKIVEIEINDFANCWYLNTEDSDCKFDIELARKFINQPIRNDYYSENKNNYLTIAKSNKLQVPNDHILFEKLGEFITFKNTSTGETINKHIKSFDFLRDIFKFYQDLYNEDILKNPSSNFNI